MTWEGHFFFDSSLYYYTQYTEYTHTISHPPPFGAGLYDPLISKSHEFLFVWKKMCGFAFLSASDHHQSLTNESRQSFTFKSINLNIACQTIFRANITIYRFIHPLLLLKYLHVHKYRAGSCTNWSLKWIVGHYKLRLIQIKFSFTVKTIDFWSYLKVFTGIKEKNPTKNFFWVVRKFFFCLLIFQFTK